MSWKPCRNNEETIRRILRFPFRKPMFLGAETYVFLVRNEGFRYGKCRIEKSEMRKM